MVPQGNLGFREYRLGFLSRIGHALVMAPVVGFTL